jgi:putative transposase
MAHDVQVSAGAAHDLGLHIAWSPKCQRTIRGGQAGARLRELIEAKAAEHGWRIVACEILPDHATVGAATVQRYTGTQHERPWRKERHC